MLRGRSLVPVVLAGGIGVANVLWTFGPAFEQQAQERREKAKEQAVGGVPLGEEVARSIKADIDANGSKTTTDALKNNRSFWETRFFFWDKASKDESRINIDTQASTTGRKSDDSPK